MLPPDVTRRVAVEAGVEMGWQKYAGRCGKIVAMRGFGASAPYSELMEHFGLTAENVVAQAKALLGKKIAAFPFSPQKSGVSRKKRGPPQRDGAGNPLKQRGTALYR